VVVGRFVGARPGATPARHQPDMARGSGTEDRHAVDGKLTV